MPDWFQDLNKERAMRLPDSFRRTLVYWATRRHIDHREPDFRIGSEVDPYLLRWFVVRNGRHWRGLSPAMRQAMLLLGNPREDDNGRCNIYIHRFMRSDDDRALHDHPWAWRTILLDGEYIEHVPRDPSYPAGTTVAHYRRAGDISARRRGTQPHRIELISGPVLTLFMTGGKSREWGFWCDKGWRHWRQFTAPGDGGQVSRGCE